MSTRRFEVGTARPASNPPRSRRALLAQAGSGFGLLALAGLLGESAAAEPLDPLAPRPGHFAAKATSIIWLFMNGGPSQVDTWDPKPELDKRDGQDLPGFDRNTGFFPEQVGALLKSPFAFARHGQSGTWTSELFPHQAKVVDDLAFIHSLHTTTNNHSPALFQINTGMSRMGFPCLGSWLTYGLGSPTRDLPAFVVMSDTKGRGLPKGHAQNWGSGFLPGVYQGTALNTQGAAIDNLTRDAALDERRQRRLLDLVGDLDRQHLALRPGERDLEARIESFELAFRMQTAAPEALAIDRESPATRTAYGLDNPACAHVARQCLLARRLVERGVRCIQIYSGGMDNQLSWDAHEDIAGNHRGFAAETDQPFAALIADLKQRGLLASTLVVCCGEFGRLPVAQKGKKPGRDHNPHAFTAWLAGGGIKGGVHHGRSDDFGHKAIADKVSIHDLHATILHLMGLDHERLTWRFNGRDFRLTDVEGEVVKAILT